MCKEIIKILQSLVLNYPIISEWNKTLQMPIGRVFDKFSDLMEFTSNLSKNVRRIHAGVPPNMVRKMLTAPNSDPIVWHPEVGGKYISRKKEEIKEMLLCAATFGSLDGQKIRSTIFFAFLKFIPDEFQDDVYPIFINKVDKSPIEDIIAILPSHDELELVRDKCSEFSDHSSELKTAVAFLYPTMKREGRMEDYEELLHVAGMLASNASLYSENDEITEWFEALIEEQLHLNEIEVFDLPELDDYQIENLDKAFYRKGDSLYMSDSLFKKILAPLTESIPLNLVKRKLAEQELIYSDKSGFTKKMRYRHNGKIIPKRMVEVRFDVNGTI